MSKMKVIGYVYGFVCSFFVTATALILINAAWNYFIGGNNYGSF
jgi:hypothetical protein